MAGKKRARLWEESVVVGLRDMQWRLQLHDILSREDLLNSIRARFQGQGGVIDDVALRGVIPPGFVTLDGNAESSTADVALSSMKGFCFLVEVKPTRQGIRDEWKLKEKRKRKSRASVHSKAAFRTLKRLVEDFEANPSDKERAKMLRRSLRIHQVAYWEGEDRGKLRDGMIKVEPYINACISMRRVDELTSDRCISSLKHLYYQFKGDTRGTQRLPAKEMLSTSTRIQFDIQSNGYIESIESAYGAEYEEFQQYVDWLCKSCSEDGEVDQPINCLVMTDDGFLQAVSSLRELATLLNIDLSCKPEPEYSDPTYS
ncbi:TPA: hypothetical protein ACOEOC_000221 [Stenotrophomonas maltophilia]|jgi:hypothetical protein|uniref:Uncharacterized protein n=2 Tax=Gammaproteobacteria TaxID=1236 RepID=A0AAI9G0B6_STEMA|nr:MULTISPECIES: hypothetical protein [Stenotrophomonas]MDU1702563.1 hypothetical protein [Streptococcus mitis]EJP77047.1 hypothetical protein A1OC_01856 [Stenotrophomonas maltophilia Ab55555]EKZ1926485.1 hypothetical protein [Stenotrophomonas maltophilia]EMB2744901.1 hypothetical protein [Stenotrophomonas maltophilia]MBH1417622.1 hypothetical protein [Stenotrophomonas maltophilia]